jgi:hypothetical protein
MVFTSPRRLAISLVVATIAATWLLSGVAASEALRFALFEAVYVGLPGCLFYLAFSSSPGGWLRTITIGWPLGYAIEVGAFALCAALGTRQSFLFLPLISGALTAVLLKRERGRRYLQEIRLNLVHRNRRKACSLVSAEVLLAAVVISTVLLMLALRSFTLTPLPGHFHSVAYPPEDVFAISLAAEARHHWPMTTPWVAGLPLRYYTAVFMHLAAVNQVTGVALSTVYLRLFPTTATLLLALQLWCLGRSMGRSRWAGLLAVILFFLVGAATLDPTQAWPFEGNSLGTFWGSATFMFGSVFLLGLLSVMQNWLADSRSVIPRKGKNRAEPLPKSLIWNLVILGMLVLACGAAKMFAACDVVGGLGIFWLWSIATGRTVRLLLSSIVVSMICLAVIYFTMLRSGGASLIKIQPLNPLLVENIPIQAKELEHAFIGSSGSWTLFFLGAVIVVMICLSAPVLGTSWLLLRRSALSSVEVFCLAVLLAGLAGYYLTFGSPGGAEIYFRYFGYLALVLLASGGLADFWSDTPKSARRAIILACGVVLTAGLVLAGSLYLFTSSRQAEHLWYPVGYTLIAGILVFLVVRLSGHYAEILSSRLSRVVACCIPLLGVLGLMRPLAYATVRAKGTILHQQIAQRDSPVEYGMTAALYRGLLWVRAHTCVDDVLAVNNHYGYSYSDGPSAYLYYSAFTERHIFLESWGYTANAVAQKRPFPRRLALNDDAVLRGNPLALGELARAGVSYVLVDKTHGGGAPEPSSVSQLVFSNSALDVYRLLPGVGTGDRRVACAGEM